MRLIDIDEFDYENIMCSQEQLHWLNRMVEKQPVVDAVEVVRCEDCKHYDKDALWCNKNSYAFGEEYHNWYSEDFCSYGERKE